jgi:hypothetical protein
MTEERSERPRRPRPTSGSSARPQRQDGRRGDAPKRKFDPNRKPGEKKFDPDRKPRTGKKWDKDASDKRPKREGDQRWERDGDAKRDFKPRRRDESGRDGDGKRDFKPRGNDPRGRGGKPFASRDPRRDERPARDPNEIVIERAPREKVIFPPLPDNVVSEDLHISVRAQLKTLSQDNQEFVARHLQMVALMIDQDPELAHRHALAASKKAGRIAVVRETLGVTAYTIGDFALALRELLTDRRISGSNDQLPLIVDCERGLGRPERAIEAATGVDRSKLEVGVRINLAIALSGARLDMGQPKLAQQELEIKELSPKAVYEQSPLLFRSYAEVLRELGKDGSEWDELADRAERAMAEREGETFSLIEELELPKGKNADR